MQFWEPAHIQKGVQKVPIVLNSVKIVANEWHVSIQGTLKMCQHNVKSVSIHQIPI